MHYDLKIANASVSILAGQLSKSADSGAVYMCIWVVFELLLHSFLFLLGCELKLFLISLIACLYPPWLQLELVLSSGTVSMAIYSLIAGIFGMNIPFSWNDNHNYVFKWVSAKLQHKNLGLLVIEIYSSSLI